MYSGEAKDSHLARIAAHDEGSGVLNPNIHGQPRVIPPVLKGGEGFQKHDFLLIANMLDISDHFVGERVRAVPGGDPLKQKAVLLRDGFLPEEIRGAYQAWNFLDAVLQSEKDRAILKRCRSPRKDFEFLGKWYDLQNEVATQHLFDKFHEFSMPQNSNPIRALHALEDIKNQMEEKGIGRIPDTVLHARFVRALPAEYNHAKETLQSMKNRDRDEIIRVVSTRYFNLPQKKVAQRSSRPLEHAFFSSESGGRSGTRRGRGRNRGGGRGSSRGGTAIVEVVTTVPVVLAVVHVDPKGEVEATTAPVAVGVAAAEVVVIHLPAAVGAAGVGAARERSAPRRRAILCSGALGAQVLAARGVSAH